MLVLLRPCTCTALHSLCLNRLYSRFSTGLLFPLSALVALIICVTLNLLQVPSCSSSSHLSSFLPSCCLLWNRLPVSITSCSSLSSFASSLSWLTFCRWKMFFRSSPWTSSFAVCNYFFSFFSYFFFISFLVLFLLFFFKGELFDQRSYWVILFKYILWWWWYQISVIQFCTELIDEGNKENRKEIGVKIH